MLIHFATTSSLLEFVQNTFNSSWASFALNACRFAA